MYLPRVFEATDRARVRSLIEAHPFATFVVPSADGAVEIAHLPCLFDPDVGEHGRIRAHVAIANPVAELVRAGARASVVFHGPDAYVSPSWYEQPTRQVPTWNYAVVHAHGRLSGPATTDDLLDLLDQLARRFEGVSPAEWRLCDLDAALRAELVREIVGFSIVVESLEAKLKLSQNRSPADRERVRLALANSTDPRARSVASLMAGSSEG